MGSRNYQKIVFLIMFLFIGCERPVPVPEVKPEPEQVVVLTDSLETIKQEFNKLSKEDQESFYKQIAGAVEYLKHVDTIQSTDQFYPILNKVKTDFGWDDEKYPSFSDAMESFLIEQNVNKPKLLDSESDREWFRNVFVQIKEAIKEK